MDYRERWELKEYQSEQRLGRRVVLFQVALAVLFIAYLLTFWHLQVTRGTEYAVLAENNRLRRIPVPPTRGAILDRNGEVLASTRPAVNLVLVREGLTDPDRQLRRLGEVLGIPWQGLRDRLQAMKGRPTYEPLVIREDASLSELARVEARREWFPSVDVEQAALRDYPDGAAVAHAVGYVGEVSESALTSQREGGTIEQGDVVGKAGIENSYDDVLRGRRGWRLVTVNSIGRTFGEAQPGKDPEDGHAIRLTIDVRLQRKLVEAMGEEVGAGVFLDPRTGEVLALASTPAYDPNVFAGRVARGVWQDLITDPRRPLNDRAIGSFYAPGSTFKILMSVAGLETGAITPSTVSYCSGSAMIYGTERLCWKKGGHGGVAVHEALVHSCNVFYYRLGQQVGIDAITKYGAMFHLGGLTGIDLPGERRGILPSVAWKKQARGEDWYAGDTISIAIGQGLLAVTPVQMATLVSGIATGSVPTPHLRSDAAKPPEKLPVRPETLAVIRSALADVVEEGTGHRASLGEIHVAGKTGTAQVFKKSRGVDADKLPKDERDHAWFVGYAPAERPEIAFAVVVEHGGHGGTTAAPVVRQVLEVYFHDRLPKKKEERPPDPALQASVVRSREGTVAPATPPQ